MGTEPVAMFRSAVDLRVWRRCQKRIPRGGSENSREITASAAAGNIFSRFFDHPPWRGDLQRFVLFVLRMSRLRSPLPPGQWLPEPFTIPFPSTFQGAGV